MMMTDLRRTGAKALGGVFVVALLAGYREHESRLQQHLTDLEAARLETNQLRTEMSRLHDEVTTTIRNNSVAVEAIDALAKRVVPNSKELTAELLDPAVQLNGGDSVGSGTIVCSRVDERTGEALNYVLTAWHVVRDIVDQGEDIVATVYQGAAGRTDVRAHLVAKSLMLDSALLRLETDEIFAGVARLLPRDQAAAVDVWDEIYAVGCPLGSDPLPTSGAISSLNNVLGGANYWMISAPCYFGSSGGSIFLAENHRMVGVFSKVYTYGEGVVSYMGLMTPVSAIHEWLEREELDHLIY